MILFPFNIFSSNIEELSGEKIDKKNNYEEKSLFHEKDVFSKGFLQGVSSRTTKM